MMDLLEIFIFFFLLIPFSIPTSLDNTTFKLDSFDRSMHDIIYEGHAFPSNQVIQLTGNHPNSSGRATYGAPLHLWDKTSGNLATFTTNFSFTIDSQNKDAYGDGFTFFMAPNGSHLPPDSYGSNLGLKNGKPESISPNFFAVEFDTYSNEWDPPHEHVGIDLNSLHSVKFFPWWWSDIKNGAGAEAWVSYNPISQNITILLTDANINTKSSSMSHIVDLRKYLPEYVSFGFSASTGGGFEIHSIQSWEFNSSLEIAQNNTTLPSPPPGPPGMFSEYLMLWIWLFASVAGAIFLVVLCLFYSKRIRRKFALLLGEEKPSSIPQQIKGLVLLYLFRVRKRRLPLQLGEQVVPGHVPREFSHNELVDATDNFSRMLGRGGFAKVYYGILRGGSIEVAVKKISMEFRELKDVKKDYGAEVNAISRLRHRNLVLLLGWCAQQDEFFIVYELMKNDCLDYHLFRAKEVLTWEKRYQIAMGLAWALHYMQEECQPWVLHRDIKSKNILLDSDFNAKLGDFGLARLVENGQESRTTTILIGTEGYMAPEYVESNKPSKESDVYSFGVVVLEIACGKKAIEVVRENDRRVKKILVEEIWRQYGEANLLDMVADRRLEGNYDVEQMKRLIVVGLLCAHPNHEERPSIKKALDMLNSTIPLPDLPSEMPTRGYLASLSIFHTAMEDVSFERD